MPYHTQDGQQVQLGPRLGEGAEGIVYLLQNDATTAVKVWKEAGNRRDLAAKITAMLQQPPAQNPDPAAPSHPDEESHPIVAWPTGMLLDEQEHPAGFTMPALDPSQYHSVFNYFNPQVRSRLPSIPDDQALTRIAATLAATMAALHHASHVIGDVNELNTMVGPQGQVTLVDADSMQVRDPETGRLWRCTKGRDDYTPPRLQGTALRDHDRTPDDDRFGLAVLIFKLLMDGQHPFASTSPHDKEISLSQKISKQYFPYNESGHTPPEHQPSVPSRQAWQDLDFNLRHLFRRAFDPDARTNGSRPTAEEWQQLLHQLSLAPPRVRHRPDPTPTGDERDTGNSHTTVNPAQAAGNRTATVTMPAPHGSSRTTPPHRRSNTVHTPVSIISLASHVIILGIGIWSIWWVMTNHYQPPELPPQYPLSQMLTLMLSMNRLIVYCSLSLAAGAAVYGGYLYVTAAGYPAKAARARSYLRTAITLMVLAGVIALFPKLVLTGLLPQDPSVTSTASTPEAQDTSPNPECDDALRENLVIQTNTPDAIRMNSIVRMIQARYSCRPDVWSPTVVDAVTQKDSPHQCFQPHLETDQGLHTQVGDTPVPRGLRRNNSQDEPAIPESTRDQDNNILVYWHPDHRPANAATCWLYDAHRDTWHSNP